jgi:dienelactone hydrolase
MDGIRDVFVPSLDLPGLLRTPEAATGVVVFAHGSGSSRLSRRNNYVAEALGESGFATLLFDLLTDDEALDRRNVFDIELLADRLRDAFTWLNADPNTARLPIGLFGASTGAAAALNAAPDDKRIFAVVSRGGRPDLAMEALPSVQAPTLLIVGGLDRQVIELNRHALAALRCEKQLRIVPGATHLFEEPGKLDEVVALSRRWFEGHCPAREIERNHDL